MKRIGIDARFYGNHGKGLGRYVQKLIEYLEQTDQEDFEYYIFLKKENFDFYQPKKNNFKKVCADFSWYSLKEQLFFPFFLLKYNLDLMHFAHFNVPLFFRRRFIVTIHDLILFHYPTVRNTTRNQYLYKFKLWCYRWVIASAVRRACQILAVSEYTKQDIIKELKVEKNKITVTYEGCDFKTEEISKFDSAKIFKKYAIIKPYLLYVGNAYPHKNLEFLVSSFQEIRKKSPDLSLVLVGGLDYFFQRLEQYVKESGFEGIIFTGFVSDEALRVLYQGAEIYVFPSLYEGFGLPPLEALAQGVAVASSNRTCLPEVLGASACYFDPQDREAFSRIILELLNSKTKQQALILQGKERLKLFSWQEMAQKTQAIYEKNL